MAVIPLTEPRRKPLVPPRGFSLLALGFRPFYLLAASLALLLVPLWVLVLAGAFGLQPALPVLLWHGHEMVFGFACAVIVGFLLTAAKNWTGLATPSGRPLAALAVLWLAGRVAMLLAPPLWAALIDLAFLPCAAWAVGRVLVRAGSRRNYFVLVILAALTLANALVHAAAQGWLAVAPLTGLHLAIGLIATLCTVIAGRIVPSFTANALKITFWRHARLDQLAIAASVAALATWALEGPAALLGPLALLAAIAQAVRCAGWRPQATLRTPLLWILHASHAWLIVALAVLAASSVGWVGSNVAVHLLTVGTISGLILGMITRTALGHTGRLLKAGKIETTCYALLQVALLARVLPLLLWPAAYMGGLHLSSTAWGLCFALYLWKYAPMLWHPRVDGQEG
jgi:uncharacterized protein involved in response to NO